MNDVQKIQPDAESEGALLALVAELMAESKAGIAARAQGVIDAVEAGDAAGVGLEQAAAMQAVLYEMFMLQAAKGTKVNAMNKYQSLSRLGNLHSKLTHQLKQSAAWAYRVQNPQAQAKGAGLGRNDKRVEKRILQRVSTTADGCWEAPL